MDNSKLTEIANILLDFQDRISNLESGLETTAAFKMANLRAINQLVPETSQEEQGTTLTASEMQEVRDGFVAVVEERDMLLASDQVLQEELKQREEEFTNLTAERNDLLAFKKKVTVTLGISPETHPNQAAHILTNLKNDSVILAKVRAAFK
ncbi:hypothetical protein [Pseudomonas phage LUZ7]|uniref:Uncharacterized protein n=1 Tax=Pseudomonas phage LUZ7 TaxID=655097 RepID=C8ZKF2_9CAUD|nr:hypothetical protein PP-LUZ7_gp032 [Pseudomonas phage LUZ7]CAZ66173.1 hypothetical protein [Pseudomonas phage LUZ7]